MSNQAFYILSGGVGKIEYDLDENNWFTTEARIFNEDIEIYFLKLIIDPIGTLSKYYRNQTRNSWYARYPELAQEILETASGLANNYLKIKIYTEVLFCTGDIQFIDNM